MEPRKSPSNLRKSSTVRKPNPDVVRDTEVRDPNPSLNKICPGECHQRNQNDPKFEYWSQVETEWQERWTREDAWKVAKKIQKLKEKKLHSSRLRKIGVILHYRKLSQEEEFVVVSGASMHKLETVKFSRVPITVVTAIGEVRKHEEAKQSMSRSGIFS